MTEYSLTTDYSEHSARNPYLGDHGPQARVGLHVLLEGLGEALGSQLPDVHGEDDEVEVTLNVVHDLGLEVGLPVVGADVEGHLGLDDALADVLHSGAAGGHGGEVNQLVNLDGVDDDEADKAMKKSMTMKRLMILTWALATLAAGKAARSSLMTSNSPICMAFLSSETSMSMPGRPSFFFFRASRMSSGTMPRILLMGW